MTESDGSADVKKTALEGVVGFAVSLLLSTGLLGGSTYLLFGFRDDMRQLSNDRAAVAKENAETMHAMQVIRDWSRPENQQVKNIANLIELLSNAKDTPQLDPQVRAASQRQAQLTVVTLTALKGDVQGTDFTSPILLRFRESLVGTLEPQIEMATILRNLLQVWESTNSAARGAELNRVQQLVLRQIERQARHTSVIRDVMAFHEQKAADDPVQQSETINKLASIGLKIALSGAGIVAGLGLLCWAIPALRAFIAPRTVAIAASAGIRPRRRKTSRDRASAN